MRIMTLSEALVGTTAPPDIINQLEIIDVPFISFSDAPQTGQLVVDSLLANELRAIFVKLAKLHFPIDKIVPIVAYGWDDERSMSDNNSSSFNYRLISGTNRPSNHGLGRAVDINPRVNPYFGRLGIEPAGARYDMQARGAIVQESPIVSIFEGNGWTWLGRRKEYPDYQHFEKR